MQVYAKAKELLHKELQKMTEKGELSSGSLDVMCKLLSGIKNCCKIEMYEEYAEEGQSHASYRRGYAYDDYSERRGRDRMGRYTSRDADGYSGAYNDVGRNGYSMHSHDEAKQDMIEELKHKMRTASPKEKEKIAMCIETLEEC